MKALTLALLLLMAAFAPLARAATTVLDPGPGTDYLNVWCGGQTVNEIATGFDTAANAVTLVKVGTTCHGSGRGSPNQYYLACWTVTFGRDGNILSKLWLATNHWQQGQPSIPCPVPADPAAIYTYTDGAGHFPASLSTSLVGTTTAYRAVLETSCAPVGYGDVVAGAIGAPGEQACHTFSGAAGDGVRVSLVRTSGTLLPAPEVRRPDGTVLCASTAGVVDCTLDATGLHTIVVHDAVGSATGGYNLSLTRTDVPHLGIGMVATPTPGRLLRTLVYQITVGNDGGAAATNVVVEDTLPQGLTLRSLSSTQGSCSHVQRAVTCALGDLAPAASVVVNISAVTALSTGQITNTACIETNHCVTIVTDLP